MIKLPIFLLFCANVLLGYSQVPVGYLYDCNAVPFDGYLDPLMYAPEKKVSRVHNSYAYELGHYYDRQGNKVSGRIKFEDRKIWFKKKKNDLQTVIKPGEVQSLVIGVDSFFTVTNYAYENKAKSKPIFVQYIGEFDGLIVAKHFKFA